MVKYITRYVRENYDVVKLRKDIAMQLREYARKMGFTINDAVSYLLTNMQNDVVNQVSTEVSEYVINNYSGTKSKLIGYAGGDFYIFDDLNRIFMTANANVFVEVFGGSCWCSLNISRAKFKVIVCNDIDRDLITFYKLVKERPNDIIKRLAILPASRELRDIAMEILCDESADPVTKAAMLFYTVRTTFWGSPGKGGFTVKKTRNMAKQYTEAVASITEYAKKFRDVVLECKDFREIMKLYDSEKTLFYLDPPYVGRDIYRYGFTIKDLRDMAELLGKIKGYWVLKIAEDNYKLIKDLLPTHKLEEIKTSLFMKKIMGEERPEFKYLIAHNIMSPSKQSKLTLFQFSNNNQK